MTDSAKIPQNIDSGIGRLRADSFRVASFGEGFMWCWHALLSLKTSLFWAVLLIIIISVGVSSALPVPGLTTLITFVFDSAILWILRIPVVRWLAYYSALSIMMVYTIGALMELVKCVLGFVLVKKGVWVHNIVESA